MVLWEPSLSGKQLRLHLGSADDATEVIGSLQLSDGSWLHFRAQDLVGEWPLKVRRVFMASLPMIALVLIALVTLRLDPAAAGLAGRRRHARGLREFDRARRAGAGGVSPTDSRLQRHAGRIVAMIKDRTEALAAVGHDLRTPLARLRLSVDGVDDAQTRDSLINDLNEMELMLDSLLTYFRGDDHPEKPCLVDRRGAGGDGRRRSAGSRLRHHL